MLVCLTRQRATSQREFLAAQPQRREFPRGITGRKGNSLLRRKI